MATFGTCLDSLRELKESQTQYHPKEKTMIPCTFKTNIDCMKRFMSNISGLPISPNVGDLIRVYHDTQLEIDLEVVDRRWVFTNGSNPQLFCDLHLPKNRWESLAHFITVMKNNNIS
jgi:hypothetical protein